MTMSWSKVIQQKSSLLTSSEYVTYPVQDYRAHYYDTKHKPIEFQKGIWLRSVNIRTERQSRKLDWKQMGPFTIIERIGTQAYRLELPKSMKIHPVFHVIPLEPYKESNIPGRTQQPAPSVVIEDHIEYEVEEILDSKDLTPTSHCISSNGRVTQTRKTHGNQGPRLWKELIFHFITYSIWDYERRKAQRSSPLKGRYCHNPQPLLHWISIITRLYINS